MLKRFLCTAVAAAMVSLTAQAVVNVPLGGDIQAAIDAADPGEVIVLADGEYEITEQIEIAKGITLRSANGRDKTTIRQVRTGLPAGVTSLANRVLYLNHPDAVADGLTLTGGKALGTAVADSNGAGVKIDAEGGRLLNCDVYGNTLVNKVSYGGVYLMSAAGVVSNCLVHANDGSGGSGGASSAAGIYASAGLVTHCDVYSNTNNALYSTSACSGVQISGTARLTRTAISNNVYGVVGNVKGSNPSALYVSSATAHADNCLIANNQSGVSGCGGLRLTAGTVTNCTIVGNSVPVDGTGSGVLVASGTTKTAFARLYGCVIAGNTAGKFPAAGTQSGNNVVIAHCVSDVALTVASGCTVDDCTTGDIRLNADYSLAFDSIGFNRCPAEDYADLAGAVDYFGRPRLSGSAVDVGFAECQADVYEPLVRLTAELPENATQTVTVTDPPEFPGTVEYAWQKDDGAQSDWTSEKTTSFTAEGVGAHTLTLHVRVDGAELPKAFSFGYRVSPEFIIVTSTSTDLQGVIDEAGAGTTIILEDGEYELPRELVIRKPLVFKSRNGAAQTTLRQVQTACPAGVTGMQARLLTISDGAAVDGFTLTGGNWLGSSASAAMASEHGSAVRIEEPAGGSLLNCRVVGNKIGYYMKGAVYVSAPDALVSNCIIRANITGSNSRAGYPGLAAAGGLITHCDISCNTNYPKGKTSGCGASLSGYARMSHCTVTNNYFGSGGEGDAAALALSSVYSVADNCLIANNVSKATGGGYVGVSMSAGALTNCTITGNQTVTAEGAGLRCNCPVAGNRVTIYGCVVSGNESSTEGKGDCSLSAGSRSDLYVKIARSLSPTGFASTQARVFATDCIAATAVFEDAAAGDYRLATSSEGRDECPASDYSAELLAAGDLVGNDRLSGDGVDMGAYERQLVAIEIAVSGDETKAIVGGTVRCTASITGSSADGALCAWSVDGGAQTAWDESRTFDYAPQTVGTHVVRLYVKLANGSVYGPYAWDVWGAPTHVYVAQGGNVPTLPYDAWETAATNIADALAVAANGTTITVGEGLYEISEQLEIDSGIVLKSRSGAAVTEIRNTSKVYDTPCRLVLLNHEQARCEGFTLANGFSANGSSTTADPRLRGAGVSIGLNGGTLASCVVTNCVLGNNNQGTVALSGERAVVTNCTISANRSNGGEWGAYAYGVLMSAGLVSDCRISDNSIFVFGNRRDGGAVCLTGGRMTRCMITGNRGTIRGDVGSDYPGMVYVSGAGTQVDNCLVADNDMNSIGTGIYANNGKVLNCTVVRNSGYYTTAGIYSSASAVIRNCIIQDNVFKEGATAVTTNLAYAAGANVSYCLSPDSMPEDKGNVTGTVPLRRDNRPKSGSLAQDAGSSEGIDCGALDLAGNPRVRGREIDIGCHEVPNSGLSVIVR